MPDNGLPGQKQHHPYDKGYRQLLANKRTFLELFKSFVREEWVNEINEHDLLLVDKSYILPDFSEKEADLVYRLKSKEIIFYVLLELQSTVDYLMPFRLLLYMVEIWRDIFHNTPEKERERKDFRLPAIIPAVLYNGADNWTTGLNFKEIQANYQRYEKHLLNFNYLLFDVNRYREEELYQIANLIASIFMLDQKIRYHELVNRLRRLIKVLQKLTPEEFSQLKTWLKNVMKPKMPAHLQKEMDRILDEANPWEVEKMVTNLEVTLEEMQREAETRGKKKGKLEGKKEGKKEVAKNLLLLNMDIDNIAKATGLTKEELEKLQKQLQVH